MNEQILEILDGDFEHALYEAAIKNLEAHENKLRFNNFSYAMRELSRHVLHRLAPDESVVKCCWYTNITGQEGRLARTERVRYATQGGLSDKFVNETLGLDLSAVHKRLNKAIDALSRYTHIEEKVFALPDEQVNELVIETIEAFAGLSIAIRECRAEIIDGLEMAISDSAVHAILMGTIQTIDELATHHFIEEVYVEEIYITDITHDTIFFQAMGSIEAQLQWGSDSDLKRGDGAIVDESFPFVCKFSCPVENPEEDALEIEENGLEVSAEGWWPDKDEDAYFETLEEAEPIVDQHLINLDGSKKF